MEPEPFHLELKPDTPSGRAAAVRALRKYKATDKKTRAIPVSDAWQGHRVLVPMQGAWVNDYLTELRSFTGITSMRSSG